MVRWIVDARKARIIVRDVGAVLMSSIRTVSSLFPIVIRKSTGRSDVSSSGVLSHFYVAFSSFHGTFVEVVSLPNSFRAILTVDDFIRGDDVNHIKNLLIFHDSS